MEKRTIGVIFTAILILFSSLLLARKEGHNPAQAPTYNLTKAAGTNGPDAAAMTINNLLLFVDRNVESPLLSTSGIAGDYPIGTAGIIFMEGPLWGARVRDGAIPKIRVNGSTYETGLRAGRVLYDVDGQVTGSEDRTVPHVWRVRRDYATANLTADAGYSLSIAVENVTATHIRTVYDQYDYDWQNWPADQGAPFDDLDNDGTYDPAVDIPGYPGAAQTIWLVTNDLPYFDSDVGYTVDPSTLIYGSPAIGMEIQLTMWAYDFAPDSPLGNAIFRQTRLIYTGLPETPDTARLDSMYIAQWSDPDLGTWTDDFVGCDTLLDLGYVYNSVTTDAAYMNDFGLPVPAAGYTLLKGPIINGDTLGMTTFGYFGAGSISDPNMGHYSGALEWWNRMEGFMPIPSYPTQCPWTDPITGEITKFPLSGDPIAGTGWIDGIIMPPGDKRMYQVTGPFTMALGDTQDVVVALIGAMGNDNISSLAELKKSTQFIRQSYRNNLVLNGFIAQADYDAQDSTSFTLNVSTVSSITTVSAKFRNSAGAELATVELLDDGSHWDQESGDLIFGARVTLAKTAAPLAISLSLSNGLESYAFNDLKMVTNDGPISIPALNVSADYLNADGAINPGEKAHLSLSLLNEGKYAHSGLKANLRFSGPVETSGENYQYISVVEPGVHASVMYDMVDSDTYSEVIISESALAGDTLIANVSLSDDLGNEWEASQAILIEPYKEPLAAPILAVHSAGFADASVAVKVIDFFALTGDDYEVYFDRQHYYMDVDGAWKETNYPDSVGKALGTAMDVSPSTITGIAMTSPIPGTRDLMLTVDIVSTDYDYAEGVKLTFPLSVVINSATSEDGITAIIDDLENTVLFGAEVQDSTDLTGGGVFSGGELLQVNVDTPSLPLDVDYIIYDDGWATLFCADPANAATCESYGITDAVVVNAEGTFTISELAYIFKTEDHWNLRNLTTSSVLYEDMTEMGTFNNGGAHEGFVVRVEGTYDEPLDFESYAAVDVNGSSTADDYHIVGYYTARWARSARCREPDVWGAGTDDLSLLEKDIQLRFTGVYDDPVVIGNQTLHPIKPGTGSIATFIGSRYCIDLEDHPMANDVSTERNADGQFLIRIPFEVWDVESDPPKQINFLVYDRVQHPVESIDFYAFNPVNRMYCYILHTPYDATHIADVGTSSNQGGTDVDSLTWGLIFYETNWASGDTVTLRYIGPIQRGVDLFTFTTLGLELDPDFDTPESFVLSQNYPNPFNPNTTFQYDLPTATNVVFVIYDILGREIVRLVDAPEDAGPHQVIWTGKDKFGRDLASGVYIYRLVTPEYTKSIKMLLLK